METREKEKNEATKEMNAPKALKQEKSDTKVIAKPKRKPLL